MIITEYLQKVNILTQKINKHQFSVSEKKSVPQAGGSHRYCMRLLLDDREDNDCGGLYRSVTVAARPTVGALICAIVEVENTEYGISNIAAATCDLVLDMKRPPTSGKRSMGRY